MLHRVKLKDFEQAVLELAMTTRVPLTRANIAFYTGASTKEAEKFLDEMLREGFLEFDSDDNGDLFYTVNGAQRSASGPTSLTRCSACQRATGAGSRCTRCGKLLDAQLRALKAEVDRAGSALDLVRRGSDLVHGGTQQGDKNLVVAGFLGLFGGPIGLFYSAPVKEAGLATLMFLLAWKFLPALLFVPLLSLVLPVSAVLGWMYAWRYNRTGKRSSLILEEGGGGSSP